MITEQQAREIIAGQARIECKLDALLAALVEEDPEERQPRNLDGDPVPGERDQTQSLG